MSEVAARRSLVDGAYQQKRDKVTKNVSGMSTVTNTALRSAKGLATENHPATAASHAPARPRAINMVKAVVPSANNSVNPRPKT